ncbi:HipA N-terminal domain-containing protein [Bifidobacterium cebidarum]|uniref:Transcriptional regulator n=1 Tax=Bifidobacterium cebidarum TaxID=2650773 RepID=A0A6I1G887_9BIFI|nr:HipA N-terminal domain-containing protein [Bifidobacterium cebidarum]KAB7787389.1 transcriptional regulator [Bifidobacterium cebidarum]
MTKVKALTVLLEGIPIGVLEEDATGKHSFTYDLTSPSNAQLSLSMPRRAQPWKGLPVEAYIDGILCFTRLILHRSAR